ncbi:hypothetical protein C8R43DRAFT_555864 [Mycena crocata]|nr:hypothetical protein C8R43DRAFT_555864 [Mycena crocata]
MTQFLDLPPELILECLAHLPLYDLNACLKSGNRVLHAIIVNSVLIWYRLEQERACVEENPYLTGNSVISDRLADLRRREANWLNFTPTSRHTLTLDFRTSGIYDLASDVYLIGDTSDENTSLCTGIRYILTSSTPEGVEWHRVEAGKPIADFGTALVEHDLIAMVTYTPHSDNSEMASVDVLLLKFSTGTPHPQATHPTLHVQDVELHRGWPGISIEIVGDNLALSIVYWNDERRDLDTLHVYDWKAGVLKTTPHAVNNTGITFLREDLIIVPNSLEATLDILHVPAYVIGHPPRLFHSFDLPKLEDGHGILSFQCRGEPNPRPSAQHSGPTTTAKFLPSPQDSLILFSFEVDSWTGITEHMFVLNRTSFISQVAASTAEPTTPWVEWGPQCTRFLDSAPLAMHYITVAAGQRLATIAHDAWRRPAPICVLDFNGITVATQRAQAGPVDGPHATVCVVEADSDGGDEEQMDQLPFAGQYLPFAEPVRSLLPYVETTSKELFDYGAVLLNDENIIGARHGLQFGVGSIGSLEVIHFG